VPSIAAVTIQSIAEGGWRFENPELFDAAIGFGFSVRVAKMKKGGWAMPDGGDRRDLVVEYRPVDGLFAYARNARTHSENQVAEIAGSIREFGFTNPVLMGEDGTLIAGHGRILAARKLGLTAVPAIVLTGLTKTQRQALTLADNRIALNAGWDRDLLALEIGDLQEAGFDLGLTGFSGGEIAGLLQPVDESEAREDGSTGEIPDPVADPIVQCGDLWVLGEHRLLCGDSANSADVARVMASEAAGLCFTSPPYGNQRDYTTGGIGDWQSLMRGVFTALPMAGGGQILVNLGLIHRDGEWQPYWAGWIAWMREQGWRRFGLYCWDQGPGLPGDWGGRFAPSFELVFHFNRIGRKPNKTVPCKFAGQDTHLRADGHSTAMRRADGSVGAWTHAGQPTQEFRIADSVIRIGRHKARGIEVEHPAVFPVAFAEHIIAAFTGEGDVCFEPFSGSGTTMIAAERRGRRCRAIDIAPEYVDVALRRFAKAFPDTPVFLDGDGRTYDEIAAERRREKKDLTGC
jgi:DNA modification methylase